MEKKVENAEQSPKSARPPIEKGETQSKPKTGKIIRVVPMGIPFSLCKIIRVVPMGIPFSPKRFKEIHELSQRSPSNKISKS